MELIHIPHTPDTPTFPQAVEFSEDNCERSATLHLSQILDSMELAVYGPRKETIMDLGSCQMAGFLWERALQAQMLKVAVEKGWLIRPGEVECDGVWMTPDGMMLDTSGEWGLEEWKCSWKRMRQTADQMQDISDQTVWRWWAQQKAYCRALGLTVSTLRVFWVAGNYRDLPGPRPDCWRATFTQTELDENWAQITNHAKYRGWL